MDFEKYIRDVPDYPKKGILFKDITPLLKNGPAFEEVIATMKKRFQNLGVSKICAIESRGFIFGAPLAYALGVGYVPVRKKGKLPWQTFSQEYALEYGTDQLEIHTDAVDQGEKVLIIDDLLATGGTVSAVCTLMKKLEAHVVGLGFLVELGFLGGREKLKGYEIFSLIKY